MSESDNAEWWVHERDRILAAIERQSDAETVIELRLAVEVCDRAIERLQAAD